MRHAERDAEHARDDIAERELGRADRDVRPQLAGLGERQMAPTIWVGAARNSALATTKRLTSSHIASPPRIDSTPAKRRANTRSGGGAGKAAETTAEDEVSSVAIGSA